MNKHKTQEELIQLLKDVEFHDLVIDEIKALVLRKGQSVTKEFVKLFQKNKKMIDELGRDITKTNNFEKLTGVANLYSMKFKSPSMNLRMLFSYDEVSNTIFLHLFYEKDDSGMDSYSKHIPIAKERMKDLEVQR